MFLTPPILIETNKLKTHPSNPRFIRKEKLESLKRSIIEDPDYMQHRALLVNPQMEVFAGNQRLRACIALGWKEVPCYVLDLDEEKQRRWMIKDNASSGEWDQDMLANDGWDAEQLKEWGVPIDWEAVEETQGLTDPDDVPEVPEEPTTKPGDLWILGDHRLLCGDSTKAEDVERLMNGEKVNLAFTSPPYAEQREYDEESGFKPILPDKYVEWFKPIQENVYSCLELDGSWFVNIKPASRGLTTELYVLELVLAHAKDWGWNFATEFCWERAGIPQEPQRRFKNQFEPIYQFTKGEWKFRPMAVQIESKSAFKYGGKAKRKDASNQGVDMNWNHAAPGMAYPGNRLPTFSSSHEALGHGAAFPVGLPEWFIKAYTDKGDIVYDPFAGSGSTLLASEQTGRKAVCIEISPKYCDVIVKRWEDFTGKKAELWKQ